jgi:hypothetical protein
MKRAVTRITLVIIAIFLLPVCGQSAQIVLIDGSHIYGDIESLDNGVYTVKSYSLGRIKIDSSRIRYFRYTQNDPEPGGPSPEKKAPAPESPPPNSDQNVQALQNQMVSNPEIMDLIQSMQNNPEIQSILNDPETMEAIRAGNIGVLLSNPAIQNLMKNPKVNRIREELEKNSNQ